MKAAEEPATRKGPLRVQAQRALATSSCGAISINWLDQKPRGLTSMLT
jgi:hypothetical protein